MPLDWDHIRHETAAAQLTFLRAEVDTGMTLARIALKTRDHEKFSRNYKRARKAYDAIACHIEELNPNTPQLEQIREKLRKLSRILKSLEERR